MIIDMGFSRLDPACRLASGRAVAIVDVPLRERKVPASSFDRMVRLSRDIVQVLVEEFRSEGPPWRHPGQSLA